MDSTATRLLGTWIPFLAKAAIAGLALAFVITWWIGQGTEPSAEVQINMVDVDDRPKIQSYADAVRHAAPAVVNIYANKVVTRRLNPAFLNPSFQRFFGDRLPTQRQAEQSLGSGVIVSANGYILTNNHVIEGADDIQAVLSTGETVKAYIVDTNPETDLAVLKVNLEQLPAAVFTSSSNLEVGDVVLAIGNPFGIGQAVTMGIVSATGRHQLDLSTFEDFIQTDAAINSGNSGGALINTHGELVGINTAIFREGGAEGIGFAIPSDIAAKVLQWLIGNGRVVRDWLGVRSLHLRNLETSAVTLPGVQIGALIEGGPLAEAGLLDGDVLTQINGQAITGVSRLKDQIAEALPGSELEFLGVRGGNQGFRARVRLPAPNDNAPGADQTGG
ncbi:MAG: AlgW protein [Lysobacteraceae bacterium]|nr:MAG: AlgW protein [Xanthomonadaceae bacterium]